MLLSEIIISALAVSGVVSVLLAVETSDLAEVFLLSLVLLAVIGSVAKFHRYNIAVAGLTAPCWLSCKGVITPVCVAKHDVINRKCTLHGFR